MGFYMAKNFMFFLIIVFSLICFRNTGATEAKVRVGVLPILDVLPIYVGIENGYFDKYQLKVEIIPCASAAERDQLIVAKSLDVIVNDLLSIASLNRERINVIGVRYAMLPNERSFQFAIVGSKKYQITRPQDLKNMPIGVSPMTIAHYVTEKLLIKEGIMKEDIKTVAIPRIPDRLSSLTRGDLVAACLPEPFVSVALSQGMQNIVDDRKYPYLSGSLYSVTKGFAEKNPEVVARFFRGVEMAIQDIEKEKGRYEKLMAEKKLLPPDLIGKYVIPDFPKAQIPDEKIWQDVVSWLMEKEVLKHPIRYTESISFKFIQK